MAHIEARARLHEGPVEGVDNRRRLNHVPRADGHRHFVGAPAAGAEAAREAAVGVPKGCQRYGAAGVHSEGVGCAAEVCAAYCRPREID